MPAIKPRPIINWTPSSPRRALAVGLRVAETGMATIRRDTDRLLGRAQMHLRAWREALDPTTADWVSGARLMDPKRTADEARSDLERRIEEARRRV